MKTTKTNLRSKVLERNLRKTAIRDLIRRTPHHLRQALKTNQERIPTSHLYYLTIWTELVEAVVQEEEEPVEEPEEAEPVEEPEATDREELVDKELVDKEDREDREADPTHLDPTSHPINLSLSKR